MSDKKYWNRIFHEFRSALDTEVRVLPSVSLIAQETGNDPFAVLVSTVISLRTKDEVTHSSSRRLLDAAPDAAHLAAMDETAIQTLIFPCGFFKRKARQLKTIAQTLVSRYGGKVPSSQQELLSLPGVGIKSANLTLNLGFNIPAICVDCHVHQIANRMGWVNTKTPEETVSALESIMPEEYWIPLNELLVSYGQNICRSLSPLCSKCPENDRCPKNGVEKHR